MLVDIGGTRHSLFVTPNRELLPFVEIINAVTALKRHLIGTLNDQMKIDND